MHPNPAFRGEAEARNIEFARKRAFGVLAVNGEAGPLVSHVPFILSGDGSEVELHLVRSNPIVACIRESQPGVLAVTGCDAYISPDWYGVEDQVPTWNYVAVHLRGALCLMTHEELHGVLERLSADMEERLLPKKPWTSGKMDQVVYGRMQRQIVPVRMKVETINGTWKLSQNKPEEVRLAAAEGLAGTGFGSELEDMIRLMREQ